MDKTTGSNTQQAVNKVVFICILIFLFSLSWCGYLLNRSHTVGDPADLKLSDYISACIAFFSAIAGIVALVISIKGLRSANESQKFTRNAHEGELYIKMMERYSSNEMRDALRILGKFRHENKHNLKPAIARWNLAKHARDKVALEIEDARHKVKYFYRDLMQLNQAGYLSRDLTKRILNTGGRHLFLWIVSDMEEYANTLQFKDEFSPFNEIYAELEKEQVPSFSPKQKPRVVCLIPARYDATRFPGKLMSMLVGKTVIRRTYENIISLGLFDFVAVVTNSAVIKKEIEDNGGNVIYKPVEHESGSDRIAEAVKEIEADIIINVQGDEPFVKRQPLEDMLNSINLDVNDNMVASLMYPLDDRKEIESSDYVKVVCDKNNFALYFSRSIVPYQKRPAPIATFYEHIGVYAFTRKALIQFSELPPTPLEQIESVECLRFLENGIPLKMIVTQHKILEIDTEEDKKRAEEILLSHNN